jgi:hypothetical protein
MGWPVLADEVHFSFSLVSFPSLPLPFVIFLVRKSGDIIRRKIITESVTVREVVVRGTFPKSDPDITIHGAVGFRTLIHIQKAESTAFVFNHMFFKGRLLGPNGVDIPLSLSALKSNTRAWTQ